MKNLLTLLTVALVFSLGTVSAEKGGEDGKETKLYAVKFHADYCGGCKALTPSLNELHSKLEGDGVEFVKFDFTSADSKSKSEKMASKLGLSELYSSNKGTGYVLLVDAGSKETVGKLTSKQSVDEMYKSIKKNL
jgi:thiol-disulfide isomerase/thioredoxin